MIKEFKANYYRLFRSKSFYIITGILLFFSLLSAFFIKFVVDDPFGVIHWFVDQISQMIKENPSDGAFLNIYLESVDVLSEYNDLAGVIKSQAIGGATFLLYSLLVILFVGKEFKSRFYINHYSGNTPVTKVVFTQWLSLASISAVMQLLTAGLTILLCSVWCTSFHVGNVAMAAKYMLLAILGNIAYLTFAYMVTFIRKGTVLATVLSCLYTLGFLDILFTFLSVFIKQLRLLALSVQIELTVGDADLFAYLSAIGSILFFIFLYLGITLVVAKRRDAY